MVCQIAKNSSYRFFARPSAAKSIATSTASAEGRWTLRTAALQLVNQANVVPRTEYIHGDAQHDQARAEPERGSVWARLKTRLAALQRLQGQTETSHHKAKAHQRQTCSIQARKVLSAAKWSDGPLGGRSVISLLSRDAFRIINGSPSFCPVPGSGRWPQRRRLPHRLVGMVLQRQLRRELVCQVGSKQFNVQPQSAKGTVVRTQC